MNKIKRVCTTLALAGAALTMTGTAHAVEELLGEWTAIGHETAYDMVRDDEDKPVKTAGVEGLQVVGSMGTE
ncbi:hypothetical protein ACFQL8_37370 [Streptomyces goshikiensis]|uniref:hypothetical protein n=1 Tax=Streptomyces goshikiensis TaxID=1942 RepID=UPI001677432A|nr:hypothetical protein [Streptomyces goshikiensis]GHD80181.1 hypothetical protein GCM10010336_63480 [Streptomyces goshikiensis]